MVETLPVEEALGVVREHLPVVLQVFDLKRGKTGLVIVDEVNGFATPGAGALAPPAPDDRIERMIDETDRMARVFAESDMPILAFLDTHQPGKPEPPYPPHCESGSGEEELVPRLAWLEGCPQASLIRKDCINGFVGATSVETGENGVVRWINGNGLESVVVVGICTDVCVMDFVLTLLSARNHGMMPTLADVVVYEPGCSTYDLNGESARALGLPETASHPQALAHHMGLYFMASRGARLASSLL